MIVAPHKHLSINLQSIQLFFMKKKNSNFKHNNIAFALNLPHPLVPTDRFAIAIPNFNATPNGTFYYN